MGPAANSPANGVDPVIAPVVVLGNLVPAGVLANPIVVPGDVDPTGVLGGDGGGDDNLCVSVPGGNEVQVFVP